ncbi:MAG TPA: PQQ-dependent sugar dehydrogenase [Oligoflexus sp.]|uniref:PQQ-dependent sugar dehydrogenase n=1 Tax=Oligoflexus sp. TaxID=1971216 RepID=UPI002D39E648|nr:PQQ-dependent sugar dehydrogenase [Oligoflexus sp.]HYX36913.1 PQQ-dependent sugar dehydrogenase [Oligoflexus sp.]
MENPYQKQIAAVLFIAASAFAQYGCGPNSATSSLQAKVGFEPVTVPALIQAENFNAAVELSQGNSGTACDATNDGNVDIRETSDIGGGCAVGWTRDGESLDYYILNRSSEATLFDLEVRIASGSADSSTTIESPPGNVIGTVKAAGDDYSLGWENWITRTLADIKIGPGLQIVRVKFTGGQDLNHLNFKAKERTDPGQILAEEAIKRSCGGCHSYLLSENTVNWAEVIKRAAPFKQRILDAVSPMPPSSVTGSLQISSDERDAILNYVADVANHPVEQTSPISTKVFTSKGMKLQRDLMAEGAGHIWGMIFLPDGNLLTSLKSGEIRLFDVKKRTSTDIKGGPRAAQHGQGGLFDIAISSDFGDDRKIFMSYAKDLGGGQYTTALSSAEFDGKEFKNLKEIFVAKGSTSKGEHFGGRIVVDSDGSIWLSIGERNERWNSQQLDNHLGKILHLTETGAAHPNNPFINGGGLPEIYSYGHRNPQGLARNLLTGEIWAAEHGAKGGDEINVIRAGLNFGWPKATHGTNYDGSYIGPAVLEGTEQPLTYWVPSIAPSGLQIYSSDAMPAWKGLAIQGTLVGKHLNLVEIKNGTRVSEERLFLEDGLRIREVEMAPNGDLWYAADSGQLFRIRRAN